MLHNEDKSSFCQYLSHYLLFWTVRERRQCVRFSGRRAGQDIAVVLISLENDGTVQVLHDAQQTQGLF